MANINASKVVGETFEDMSVVEMSMVQGSGDVGAEFTTSPACVALSVYVTGAYSAEVATVVASLASLGTGIYASVKAC